jgi:hypothetical protein
VSLETGLFGQVPVEQLGKVEGGRVLLLSELAVAFGPPVEPVDQHMAHLVVLVGALPQPPVKPDRLFLREVNFLFPQPELLGHQLEDGAELLLGHPLLALDEGRPQLCELRVLEPVHADSFAVEDEEGLEGSEDFECDGADHGVVDT